MIAVVLSSMKAAAPHINMSGWHAIHKVTPFVRDVVTSFIPDKRYYLVTFACDMGHMRHSNCAVADQSNQVNGRTGSPVPLSNRPVNQNTQPHLNASLTAFTSYTPCHEQGLKPVMCDADLASLLTNKMHMTPELVQKKVKCPALSAYAFC